MWDGIGRAGRTREGGRQAQVTGHACGYGYGYKRGGVRRCRGHGTHLEHGLTQLHELLPSVGRHSRELLGRDLQHFFTHPDEYMLFVGAERTREGGRQACVRGHGIGRRCRSHGTERRANDEAAVQYARRASRGVARSAQPGHSFRCVSCRRGAGATAGRAPCRRRRRPRSPHRPPSSNQRFPRHDHSSRSVRRNA